MQWIDLGDKNWPIVRDFVDNVLLVSDDEIVAAMKLIWERMKLVGIEAGQQSSTEERATATTKLTRVNA